MTRRAQYEKKQRRRALVIASASSILVVLALVILVPMTPGWEKVQRSFFNGNVLAKSFPKLLDAFKINIMIFAWSAPAIAILGLLIALARDVKSPALFPLRIFGAVITANALPHYRLDCRNARQCATWFFHKPSAMSCQAK